MGYLMVAIDLDGTLLRSDGSVSERSVRALRAAEEAGIVVVVATGRPPRWIRPVAERLGHTGLAVCANGAVVYDLHTDRVAETRPLDSTTVRKVAEIVRAAVSGVAFAVETTDRGFGREPGYRTHDGLPTPWVAPIDELAVGEIVKLLVQHEEMGPDGLLVTARDLVGHLVELTHSSASALLEVSATGVTKASTVSQLAAQHGFGPDDVLAFGDMPNDLPLLAWAGTGYAMANAHPDVLAAAEHVAPANDDDGVATILGHLLDQGSHCPPP